MNRDETEIASGTKTELWIIEWTGEASEEHPNGDGGGVITADQAYEEDEFAVAFTSENAARGYLERFKKKYPSWWPEETEFRFQRLLISGPDQPKPKSLAPSR